MWTGGHEENVRFRSVNINHGNLTGLTNVQNTHIYVGPYEAQWGAVTAEYAPRLREKVLEWHHIDIYQEEGKWYPDTDFLIGHGIPVLSGLQRVDDTVLLRD